MSASIGALQPELQPWCRALLDAAAGAGLNPRLTSTRRSHQDQVRLFRAAQAGQSPYPAARPGTSAHEYGWAFDMVVSPLDYLPDVGALWEEWGGVWGGHPTRRGSGYDPIHFEWPGWRSLVDWNAPDLRQQREQQGGVPPIVNVVGDVIPQLAAEEGSSADVGQRIVEGLKSIFGL